MIISSYEVTQDDAIKDEDGLPLSLLAVEWTMVETSWSVKKK